jgi:hypothetical protein
VTCLALTQMYFLSFGIRTSLDRPVILVKDNVTDKIPFDLNAINTLTYDSSITPWSLQVEIPRLVAHVQSVMSCGESGNAMWAYFGLTKRGVPSDAGDNPIEAKLDLLLREVSRSPALHSGPLDLRPDPLTARTPSEFMDILMAFRVWTGNRSLRQIAEESGHRISPSTVRNILTGGQLRNGSRSLTQSSPDAAAPRKTGVFSLSLGDA